MMKWGKITLILLLSSFTCLSQEICNNAIDDDADGLIDINDSDCLCTINTGNGPITSYIPNPSFENHTLCPTGPSQLSFADVWQQCTNTTADFMHTCGYIAQGITDAGLLPFPEGDAIAGIIFSEEWKEYLGAGLSQPMEAGKTYQMSFSIASLPVNGDGETCNEGIINYGAVKVTLYGAANTAALPVNTIGAPTVNPEWFVLGEATYLPVSSWGQLTIIFTPNININAVMLGAPENLPATYQNNNCYPYFLFDNLALNESDAFGGAIQAQGDYCSGTLSLTVNTEAQTNTDYQWYKNGIAIVGSTGNTVSLSNALPQEHYSVKITNNEGCFITPSYTVVPVMAAPILTVTQPDCNNSSGVIKVETNAALYSFNNGMSWSTSNVSAPLGAGTYAVKVKSHANCESDAVQVTLSPVSIDTPIVQDVAYCQYSTAVPLTATGTNLLWYTYQASGTGSATAPVPSTIQTGTTTYYVSQTINGCESARTAVNVSVTPTPSAPVVQDVFYCQFSTAEALTALGTDLVWYNSPSGGTGSTLAPVPSTRFAGVTEYYVSQVQNGCESDRSLITVTVFEAPAMPETASYISYMHYDVAGPLTATGQNLEWFDAEGNFLATAPRPDTSILGTTKYYVSQSKDGCESPKAEIVVEIVPKEVTFEFPKFFSPNGDGHNEVWNITKSNTIADAEVQIYDRNGMLIKQVRPNDNGWDGTFNGRALPATDYWFRVTYKEYGVAKEYSSHFSLVR